jgi:hypothetical protein
MSDMIERLHERAKAARAEGTATALGDALHFEKAAAAIESLREEARITKFWLDLRERQLKRNREGWLGAAEEALAGNPEKLRRRVQISNMPMIQLVGSEDPDEARAAASGIEAEGQDANVYPFKFQRW